MCFARDEITLKRNVVLKGKFCALLTNVYFSFPSTAQMPVLLYWVKPCSALPGRHIYLLEVHSRPVRVRADVTKPQEKAFNSARKIYPFLSSI